MKQPYLKQIRLPLEITSWGVFALSLALYWITADPGASYWDCPEYITTASKMEIGHPPGNPVWMLAMRVATIPFPSQSHAFVINLCSGAFMAFAAFFLCRIIFSFGFLLIRHIFKTRNFSSSLIKFFTGIISAGAALCFSFCDSAWFSAVEAEVYALSAMLSGATLWIISLWFFERSKARSLRLLILLGYLIGLSLGVHQLNLLCIPVFALIMVYKKYPSKIKYSRGIFAIITSLAVIVFILYGLMGGLLKWASMFELLFVNNLGLPCNTGVVSFIIILGVILITAILISNYFRNYIVASALWMLAFIILGFSSFGIIMIRSIANPYMNEGNPSDIFALTSYIARDQYPSIPLIYGHTPFSKPMFDETFEAGRPFYSYYTLKREKPIYVKSYPGAVLKPRSPFVTETDSVFNHEILTRNQGGYLLADYDFNQVLTPELNQWFPRITSRNINDRSSYEDWAGMTKENMSKVRISETFDSLGNPQPKMNDAGTREESFSYLPTFLQHLKYFINYQVFYMYFRYVLWNFMGRQNDYHSIGEIDHGNFITGFRTIDDLMIGNLDETPDEIGKNNPGRNNYYSIPFLLAIIGIIWLASGNRISRRMLAVITLLFIMTGFAIVVYLNQTPAEPRERDYTFLGSYMAFTMWIAGGLIALLKVTCKVFKPKLIYLFIPVALFPAALMAFVNFDDHDRRNRYETTFYASSTLDFEIPSIIFTHGDNSTFPAWYASEVLGMGPQHIPIDITYMGVAPYMVALNSQTQKEFQLTATNPQIAYMAFILTKIPSDSQSVPMPLSEALNILYNDTCQAPSFPSSLIKIPVNKSDSLTINLHDLSNGSSFLSFDKLMLLDIINKESISENPRALYFPNVIDWRLYRPLDSILKTVAFGKIYAPFLDEAAADSLQAVGMKREIQKLRNLNPRRHYSDRVTSEMSVRYRGELILGAKNLIIKGDTILPGEIIDAIEKYYPYSQLLAGSFTLADSTFYEGNEYRLLLTKMKDLTGNHKYDSLLNKHTQLLDARRQQWLKYYGSLTPSQRSTLSNRSKRELK